MIDYKRMLDRLKVHHYRMLDQSRMNAEYAVAEIDKLKKELAELKVKYDASHGPLATPRRFPFGYTQQERDDLLTNER